MRSCLAVVQVVGASISIRQQPFVELANMAQPGMRMDASGLGTGFGPCFSKKSTGYESYNASLSFLKLGGRRFDGAISYGCDKGVGRAVRDAVASGIVQSRSDVFITSKIGPGGLPYPLGFNETIAQTREILTDLDLGSVDLLLVHEPYSYWPYPDNASLAPSSDPFCDLRSLQYSPTECRLSTWRAMVQIFEMGWARAIGVSNYNSSHIDEIMSAGLPLPAVNQLEFSAAHGPHHRVCTCGHSTSRPDPQRCAGDAPTERNESCATLRAYLRTHRISYNGYSPFSGDSRIFEDAQVQAVAQRHGASVGQVILNWQWQAHGVTVNPEATSEAYQSENLNFTFFSLTPKERALLDNYPQHYTCADE